MNTLSALDQIRVVLSHPTHPGNIGATARAMKTMGLKNLYLVEPRAFPHADAIARASGAVDILEKAHICDSLEKALQGTALAIACSARRRDLSLRVVTAKEAAQAAIAEAQSHSVAIVFGTEMSGLTIDEVAKCQLLAYIPANPEYSSLNLAAAVQILSYELRTIALEGNIEISNVAAYASFEDVELFYEHLERTMIEIGFLDPQKPKRLMQRMRRLFARTRLEKEELNILRGILNAINVKHKVK